MEGVIVWRGSGPVPPVLPQPKQPAGGTGGAAGLAVAAVTVEQGSCSCGVEYSWRHGGHLGGTAPGASTPFDRLAIRRRPEPAKANGNPDPVPLTPDTSCN